MKANIMLGRIMKALNSILTVALLGITSLSWTDYSAKEQLMLGQEVETEEVCVKGEGRKTLVSFWASCSAESVVENERMIAKYGGDGAVKILSVCLDEYESLFREATEGRETENVEYVWKKDKGAVLKDFKLKDGEYGSFLIDENGVLEKARI